VSLLQDKKDLQSFIRFLLDDVEALGYMIDNGWFEKDIHRIGAEQEMVLVDLHTYKPAMIAMEVIEKCTDFPWLETELAQFNLEIGLEPRNFSGKCLSSMEQEIRKKVNLLKDRMEIMQAAPLLTGILPTLRQFDLRLENLTPKKRYEALMEAINQQLLGSSYELRISGIDELMMKHDSPMMEACNTSFQVHLQVSPQEFAKYYNIAQTLAAPVMAIAANSPLVFGKRLWHETRIAMFQQSIDTRSSHAHMRERLPRVHFGNEWLNESILEIYKDDISHFRVLMDSDVKEDSLQKIESGEVPKLKALQVHNSTIYRWNRPCYGISENGKPHLRIENRVLPSGPTILDEMANAAFWLGCMAGMVKNIDDITEYVLFADVRDNFFKAARYGIDSTFNWLNDTKIGACNLIKKELIPLAREGLISRNLDEKDIDRYLDVIENRAKKHMTGARWSLRAYTKLKKEVDKDEALTVLTASILKNQTTGRPIHEWKFPKLEDLENYYPDALSVGECMTTDLFTVRKEDIIDLVGEMMDWRRIRYMPVEDSKARLVGLVTHRLVMRELLKRRKDPSDTASTVGEIMIQDPVHVFPQTPIKEAMDLMRKQKVGCLPVIKEDRELIGIITEMDFLRIIARLLDRIEHRTR